MVLVGNGRRAGRGLLTRLFRPSLVGLLTMLRNRIFLLFLLLLVFFSSLLLMTSNGPQRARFHLHSLVAETHHQIVDNIKRNFEPEGSEEKKEPLGDVDEKYLDELGLGKAPISLWPNSSWHLANNASEPVVLSAVQNGRAGEAVNFVRNSQLVLPETTIILYNLGIGGHELKLVESYCNSSNCILKTLDTSRFPGHVRNLKTNAYRYSMMFYLTFATTSLFPILGQS